MAEDIHRQLPYVDVHTRDEWSQMSRNYWITSTGLGLNLFVTIFLGCLIAIMVVAQTLYTSTMEHVKDFGTIKAIGGSNFEIYRILGEQAVFAAVGGFVIGAILTLLLHPVMAKANLNLVVVPQLWALTFGGTIAFCLAAALICFRKVARIDPAIVFRG